MAQKLFLCDLNLNGNQLKKVALEALAEAPSTELSNGRIYYNSTSNKVEIYDATNSRWDTLVRVRDISQTVVENDQNPVSGGAVYSAIAGLSGAMHFIAVLDSTEESFEAALAEYKTAHPSYVEVAGDVMVYGIKEYVFDGTDWRQLGDETIVVTSLGGATGAITVRGGQTITGSVNLSMSGNELQATLVMPVGSDILLTGYTKASAEAAIAATDTANQAFGKLEYKIDTLKEEVIQNEQTTAQALNELNDNLDALDTRVETLETNQIKRYNTTITAGSTSTIQASTHGCGANPVVSCFYDGANVIVDQSIDASGNVTLAWSGVTLSAEHPLKVTMIG